MDGIHEVIPEVGPLKNILPRVLPVRGVPIPRIYLTMHIGCQAYARFDQQRGKGLLTTCRVGKYQPLRSTSFGLRDNAGEHV